VPLGWFERARALFAEYHLSPVLFTADGADFLLDDCHVLAPPGNIVLWDEVLSNRGDQLVDALSSAAIESLRLDSPRPDGEARSEWRATVSVYLRTGKFYVGLEEGLAPDPAALLHRTFEMAKDLFGKEKGERKGDITRERKRDITAQEGKEKGTSRLSKGKKKGHHGSVENLDDDKNHRIVCEGHQVEVAALAVIGSPGGMKALPTFDHRHHRLDLTAIMVGFAIKANLHQPAVSAAGRLGSRSTNLGRNDRADVTGVACKVVIAFGVVSRVGADPQQAHPTSGFDNQRSKLVHIRPWSATRMQRENKMTSRVAHQAQLRVAMINDRFPGACDAISTSHEVRAGTAAFQAGGVRGRRFNAPLAAEVQPDRGSQQPPHLGQRQQPTRRLLHRREVGHRAEIQDRHQRRMIGQMSHEPTIVRFEKVLQHQAGEQLMLRELLGTARMGIQWQRPPRHRQRRSYDCLRRLARNRHIHVT